MDDLIQSGNIVLKDQGILDMGCVPYGYFRYVQGYTFMRKYADDLRYYVDEESYLYKEPTSKKKRPDVLVQAENKLIPEAEYYVRIAGVNKKQDSPPLYRIGSCETPMLVNSALYDVPEHLVKNFHVFPRNNVHNLPLFPRKNVYFALTKPAPKNTAEVDFIFGYHGAVIPMEVKATINLKAKSLAEYRAKYAPPFAVRTSLAGYGVHDALHSIPLYLMERMLALLP